MTKEPCDLIEDILPLYAENEVSEKTKEIVEEHLSECPNCRKLLNSFKEPNTVIPDLKESLPQADTFKQWLKRLKVWAILGVILIILSGVGIGVASYRAGNVTKKDILGTKDIVRTIEKAGIALTPDSSIKTSEYKMGDAEPKAYKLTKENGVLFVYQFPTIGERKSSYEEWLNKSRQAVKKGESSQLNDVFSANWQYNRAYAAKNTIIVYTIHKFPDQEYAKKVIAVLTTLAKTIFYNLNNGEQTVYQGEGEHWKGKVILNYYAHWWTDDKGVQRYESWHHEQPILEFKEDPNTIAGKFSYEFKTTLGGFRSESQFSPNLLSKGDNLNNYGGSPIGFGDIGGSGGAMPQKDSVYTVTVKWNGDQQETFELKAAPQD